MPKFRVLDSIGPENASNMPRAKAGMLSMKNLLTCSAEMISETSGAAASSATARRRKPASKVATCCGSPRLRALTICARCDVARPRQSCATLVSFLLRGRDGGRKRFRRKAVQHVIPIDQIGQHAELEQAPPARAEQRLSFLV